MKLTLRRNFFEIVGITAVVICSILIAFGVERLLLYYTALSPDTTKLAFALVLPVGLLLLQRLLQTILNTVAIRGGIDVMKGPKLAQDPMAEQALAGVEDKIRNYLQTEYDISHHTLAIFDWQSRQYVTLTDDSRQVLAQNHALVHFAKQFHAVFCTERRSPLADQLSDALHAEMLVFMQKHRYMFAIPLYTDQDVYGFIFLNHRDVMDSRLYATNDFSALEKFGRSLGSLLHQILIYQAIVIGKKK